MTQEELFKALRGERRTQVDLSLGQVPISPTIQSGGRYTVVVPGFSRQNSATRLSAVLAQVPQVAGQFKNIQEQAGIREANELTPDEVIRRVESGDTEAQGILASYGKEKTFQEQLYARYFSSSLQPAFARVEDEMSNLTPRQISEIGDVRAYAQQKIVEAIDPEVFNTIKDPNNRFMAVRHNLAMEALVPKMVESVVGNAEAKKLAYGRDEAVQNALSTIGNTNTPQSSPSDAMVTASIEGLDSTAFGSREIDPTTAQEIKSGKFARVGGDEKRGSSGMLYRGLEADIPTVAIHKSHGLKAKDYIKVTSDLFPEGKIFQVAGTGPAAGRLDFYSSNKEEYNKFAAQKLQSVVKVDKDGNAITLKAPPNIANIIGVEAAALATQGIARETILKMVASGLMQRVDGYLAYGDTEKANELLEFIENGDIKVEDRTFIKTFQGRAVATDIVKLIEAAEDKAERKENQILGNESKEFRNETNAKARAIVAGLPEDPTEEEQEDALNGLAELKQSIVPAQQNNQVDAATANTIDATISSFENDIKNKTVRSNSEMAAAREAYIRASGNLPNEVAKTFINPTAKSLAVYADVFGSEFIEQHKVFNTGLGKPQYTDFLTSEMELVAKDALVATVNKLMPTLDPKDPEFKTKFEEAFESKLRSNLEQDKRRMEEASNAHVDPTALSTSEQVREYLRTNGLEETEQNIKLVQNQLLAETRNTPSGELFNEQYQLKDNFGKLAAVPLLRGINDYVDNLLLRDRTDLSSDQVASLAVTASKNALTKSFSIGINNALENAASPTKKAQIRQNWTLDYVKNTGLPVEFLEGDMITTHFATYTNHPIVGNVSTVLPIDFNNGDRYFKRYKKAVMSAEALAAYANGNETLLDRVFNAGVAKGQLTESQKEDFIKSQLELGRKIGILEQLTETNEQQQ